MRGPAFLFQYHLELLLRSASDLLNLCLFRHKITENHSQNNDSFLWILNNFFINLHWVGAKAHVRKDRDLTKRTWIIWHKINHIHDTMVPLRIHRCRPKTQVPRPSIYYNPILCLYPSNALLILSLQIVQKLEKDISLVKLFLFLELHIWI